MPGHTHARRVGTAGPHAAQQRSVDIHQQPRAAARGYKLSLGAPARRVFR